jgi:hypothetical protein
VEQVGALLGPGLEQLQVVLEGGRVGQEHPLLDAPAQGGRLVGGEVVAGLGLEQGQQPGEERLAVGLPGQGAGVRVQGHGRLHVLRERRGDLRGRQDGVGHAIAGARGRALPGLGEDDAVGLLDGP